MNWRQGALLLVVSVSLVGTIALSSTMGGTGWADDSRVRVVATFYPLAYFAEQVGGDRVQVATLIPYNQEVHSWSPSTRDILRCEGADVLLSNGAGLDPWFRSDILPAIDARGKLVVDTTAGATLLPIDPGSAGRDEAGAQWDPHTWIDPVTARGQARAVYGALVERDPAGAGYYAARWADLEARFDSLDADFSALTANSSTTTQRTFFTIHAAFGYLANRYGLVQHSLIGISTDEQPSASGMARAVEEMRSHGIYTILVNPQYPTSYASTLQGTLESMTGHRVWVMSLYQMLGPVGGMDYFAEQGSNAATLQAALMGTGPVG
jgi:zinc transport system substrate-binding protein